jgi:hypothetical protein
MSNRSKAALIVIAAFVAGVMIGVAGDRFALLRSGQLYPRRAVAFAASHVVDRLGRDLELSDTQKRDVRAIVDRHHARIDAAWSNVRPQVKREIDAATAEIEAVLTPEQRTKFRELRVKAEQRRRHRGGPPRM